MSVTATSGSVVATAASRLGRSAASPTTSMPASCRSRTIPALVSRTSSATTTRMAGAPRSGRCRRSDRRRVPRCGRADRRRGPVPGRDDRGGRVGRRPPTAVRRSAPDRDGRAERPRRMPAASCSASSGRCRISATSAPSRARCSVARSACASGTGRPSAETSPVPTTYATVSAGSCSALARYLARCARFRDGVEDRRGPAQLAMPGVPANHLREDEQSGRGDGRRVQQVPGHRSRRNGGRPQPDHGFRGEQQAHQHGECRPPSPYRTGRPAEA